MGDQKNTTLGVINFPTGIGKPVIESGWRWDYKHPTWPWAFI